MANFNKVFLMGNLTRDPEIRYTQTGTAVAKLGLAVNRSWKRQDGQQQDETCFVDITAFGRQAEVISEYCSKGRPLFVEGRLHFSQWEDQQTGQRRSKLDVTLEGFQFLGSRGDRAGGPPAQTPPPQRRPQEQPPQEQPPPQQQPPQQQEQQPPPADDAAPPNDETPPGDDFDIEDDKIPF